jgi:hypothetical protein
MFPGAVLEPRAARLSRWKDVFHPDVAEIPVELSRFVQPFLSWKHSPYPPVCRLVDELITRLLRPVAPRVPRSMFDTRRILRQLFCASVLLALWTIARPAAATLPPAPFCDDRGASALAPAPLLEATDVAIQRARSTSPCDAAGPMFFASLGPGHSDLAPRFGGSESAIVSWHGSLAPPAAELLAEPSATRAPDYGARSRVERPPRA